MASDKELSAQTALAEFAALRAEVLQAFSTQWNILALQLTATAVLFSFSLTSRTRTGFLLIVPIVSYVLNGRYLRGEAGGTAPDKGDDDDAGRQGRISRAVRIRRITTS